MSAINRRKVEHRLDDLDTGLLRSPAGAVSPTWRFLTVGFDTSASECRCLATEETSPNVHYLSGLVRILHDHPFANF